MGITIQADENGALLVPPGVAGPIEPGAKFAVEPHGGIVILRPAPDEAERWWATTTPAERAAWFEEWICSLPPAAAIPLEATRRDSIYE